MSYLESDFKSGFAAVLGRPNAGKSTLVNALLGQKVAIVSPKAQTTRQTTLGVLNAPGCQITFVDTPGLHAPKNRLGEYMVRSAKTAARDADCALFLVTCAPERSTVSPKDAALIEKLPPIPLIIVINKVDEHGKAEVLPDIDKYAKFRPDADIVPVSALKGENLDVLLETVKKYMPVGPRYFPEDAITDKPVRYMAAELIREKALYFLQEEIPHGIAVEIDAFKTERNLTEIDAAIVCEKDSHKGMIIGKQGAMLKRIGEVARHDMERMFGGKVMLRLWVRVKKNWRDSEFLLKNFGYSEKD